MNHLPAPIVPCFPLHHSCVRLDPPLITPMPCMRPLQSFSRFIQINKAFTSLPVYSNYGFFFFTIFLVIFLVKKRGVSSHHSSMSSHCLDTDSTTSKLKQPLSRTETATSRPIFKIHGAQNHSPKGSKIPPLPIKVLKCTRTKGIIASASRESTPPNTVHWSCFTQTRPAGW